MRYSLYFILIIFSLFAFKSYASTGNDGADDSTSQYPSQIVFVNGSPVVSPGRSVSVTVSYDVSDNDMELTGLGLRIYYNSLHLTFVEFSNLFSKDNIGTSSPYVDSLDLDGNPSTDMYVASNWASIFGGFPGEESGELPITLLKLNFTASTDLDVESTPISFTTSSNASGYIFEGNNYNIPVTSGTWDFDENGSVNALTDGLLLMRYLFTMRGEALIDSTIASDAGLTTATEIESKLSVAINSYADIDSSGDVDALTDGLLLMRYLFNLRDDPLINSSFKPDAARNTVTEIEAYIESYMPL